MPTIETFRLVLRPLKLADAEDIFAYAKNPSVSKYTLWEPHSSVKDSLSYIRDYAFKYYQEGMPEPFGVVLKSDAKHIIGTVGCFWVGKNHDCMELACAFDEKHWNKGIAAEACAEVLEYCFKMVTPKRIQGRCKADNLGSAKVMQKIGMTYDDLVD